MIAVTAQGFFRRFCSDKLSKSFLARGFIPFLAATSLLRAQVPDVSADLTFVGNPLNTFNVTAVSKRVTDFRHHQGRIYVSYGSTDSTSRANRLLYADPVALTVGEETASFTINNEQTTRFRVFDEGLVLHIDDFVGSTKGYYLRDTTGTWNFIIGPVQDHNRDVVYFQDRVWHSEGGAYPSMLSAPRSAPNGAFVRHTQTAPTDGYGDTSVYLGETYFTFAGRLYAANANWPGTTAPFLLRYNGNDAYQRLWSVARRASADFFTGPTANAGAPFTTTHAFSLPTVEVFHNQQRHLLVAGRSGTLSTDRNTALYAVADLETGTAVPVTPTDALAGTSSSPLFRLQVLRREGRVFAAWFRLNSGNPRTVTVQVHQLLPDADPLLGASWPALFRFTTTALVGEPFGTKGNSFDYAAGRFHFAADSIYDSVGNQLLTSTANIGNIYTLPFVAVHGPAATPPPPAPETLPPLEYILDDHDLIRSAPLTAGSGTTLNRADHDPADTDLELAVTRTTNNAYAIFGTRPAARDGLFARALADGAKLTMRVRTFADQNPGSLALRWIVEGTSWTTGIAVENRAFNHLVIPANTAIDTEFSLDLAAHPEIRAALLAYNAGAGTTFGLRLDNGGTTLGHLYTGAVRVVIDDLKITGLPQGGPAPLVPDAAAVTWLSATSRRLDWGPARGEDHGWRVERSLDAGVTWTSLGIHAGDTTSLTDSAVPPEATPRYRVFGYTRAAYSAPAPALTAYETWRTDHFTPAELANPAAETTVWGDAADPDGDGFSNLIEYALPTAGPLTPDVAPAYATALNPVNGRLTLAFTRARADLRYEVLASSDLITWTVIATDPGDLGAAVAVADPVSAPRRFLRLRVTKR